MEKEIGKFEDKNTSLAIDIRWLLLSAFPGQYSYKYIPIDMFSRRIPLKG